MTKKHSVNVSFEKKDYDALKDLADNEDRTINAQARHMLRGLLHPEPITLSSPYIYVPPTDSDGTTMITVGDTGAADTHSDGAAGKNPQDALNKQEPHALQGEHQPETHDATGSADG